MALNKCWATTKKIKAETLTFHCASSFCPAETPCLGILTGTWPTGTTLTSINLHLFNISWMYCSRALLSTTDYWAQPTAEPHWLPSPIDHWAWSELTPGFCHCKYTLWKFALHTGVHWPNTSALQQCSGQNAFPTAQCSSASQADTRLLSLQIHPMKVCSSYRFAVTQHQCTAALHKTKCIPNAQCCSAKQADTRPLSLQIHPMKVCSSYTCAVTQHQCTAALLRAKCISHWSVLLCKTGWHQAFVTANTPYESLLFIHVCIDPTPVHCSTAQGIFAFHTDQCSSAS